MIYLDYAASTPMSELARQVYIKVAADYFGNASSLHDAGSEARQLLKASAKTIALTLNVHAEDIHFTSGASEGNYLAITALLAGCEKPGKHILTSQLEHSSVRGVFEKLEQEGYDVTWLPVNEYGEIEPERVIAELREDTVFASIQYVNSEIGTIQNISELGDIFKENGTIFHTDAVQAYGKIRFDVTRLNVDALTISAHKIYGPKGVGAVWINPKTNWLPLLPGASQSKELKSGTINVPGIAAFAAAAKEVHAGLEEESARFNGLRQEIISGLDRAGIKYVREGNPENVVPNILGLRFPGMEGQYLMLECNQAGLAISTGSACQVGSDKPNTTMLAIGRNEQEAREFVRLSFGRFLKEEDVGEIIHKIDVILARHFSKVKF